MKEITGKNGGTLKAMEKGETLNPNGRPKKIPEIEKVLSEFLGDEEKMISVIEAIYKKALKGDTRAAEILLDRCYGKAKQSVDLNTKVESSHNNYSQWSQEDLQALIALHTKNKGK